MSPSCFAHGHLRQAATLAQLVQYHFSGERFRRLSLDLLMLTRA